MESSWSLKVEEVDLRGQFWLSVFRILGGLVLILALVFNWKKLWSRVTNEELHIFFVIALLIGSLWFLLRAFTNLIKRGIAEYNLGTVEVDFSGVDKVEAVVSIKPRQKIHLQGIRMKAKVVEEVYELSAGYGDGTFDKKSEFLLFSTENELLVDERVEPGESWTRKVEVSILPELPESSSGNFFIMLLGGERVQVKWWAEIEILQSSLTSWRGKVKLLVKHPDYGYQF